MQTQADTQGEGGPRVGQRVRYREYWAVWNNRRGRSGEEATVVKVEPFTHRPGWRKVQVAPDSGGITDTVMLAPAGGWPRNLEPAQPDGREP